MNNNQNNLMITVKKADGTFQKVPLSDLKKNASVVVTQPSSLPKKEQPDKKEDLDLNSVPFTRKSEVEDEKNIKKQPQKTVSDRSYIMGYEDKKEAVKNDVKVVEVAKDRFENFQKNNMDPSVPQDDKNANVILSKAKNLDPSVPQDDNMGQDDKNANVILSKAKNLDPSVPQDDKVKQDDKIKKDNNEIVPPPTMTDKKNALPIRNDNISAPKQSPKETIPKNTYFANKKEKEHLNLPKLNSKDFKSPLEENLPEVYREPGELTNATPFNSFIHKPEIIQKVVNVESVSIAGAKKNILSPSSTTSTSWNDNFLGQIGQPSKEKNIVLSNIVKHKTPMQDIVSKPKIYGPLEEIQNITLVDLRRLSSDTGEAVNRLQQKFINIKEESIILYFKATDMWVKSPLYKDYVVKIGEALSQGVNLEKLLWDKNNISLKEMKALAIMNKTLEI